MKQQDIAPYYWLGVCSGVDAAIRFALTDNTQLDEVLEQFPILSMSEFPDAMRDIANQNAVALDVELVELCQNNAARLERLHAWMSTNSRDFYASILLRVADKFAEESQGNVVINRAKAVQLFEQARALDVLTAAQRAFWLMQEAVVHVRLAELGQDPGTHLDLARLLQEQAFRTGQISDDLLGDYWYHKGTVLLRLADFRVQEAKRLYEDAQHAFAEARKILDANDEQFALCRVSEGHCWRLLALLDVNPAQNLKRAIHWFEEAIAQYPEDKPGHWAAMAACGTAYLHLGELGWGTADDLSEALRLTRAALDKLPEGSLDRALSLSQEGSIYFVFAERGHDRELNLERALRCHEEARSADVLRGNELATCLVNEGNARASMARMGVMGMRGRSVDELMQRLRANLDESIRLYQLAYEAAPIGSRWRAVALISEGTSRMELVGQGLAPVSEARLAIDLYQRARPLLPAGERRSLCLMNEADAWRLIAQRDPNVEDAPGQSLRCYAEATAGLVRPSIHFATCLLGQAVLRRVISDRSKAGSTELQRIVELAAEAGAIFFSHNSWVRAVHAYRLAADAASDLENWPRAKKLYQAATKALETARGTTSLIRERQRWMHVFSAPFKGVVEACLRLGHNKEALEWLERGQARAVSDLLHLQEMELKNVSREKGETYKRLRSQFEELHALMHLGDPERPVVPDLERGRMAHFVLEQLGLTKRLRALEEELRREDPDFLAVAAPLWFEAMQALARELSRPMIAIHAGRREGTAFVVWPEGDLDCVALPGFSQERLNEWLRGPEQFEAAQGWLPTYIGYRSGQLQWNDWAATIVRIAEDIGESLMQPIHARLKERSEKHAIFLLAGSLGLLPLHAARWREDEAVRYLIDDIEVSYAPSAMVLERCVRRESRPGLSLIGVGNPDGSLPFCEWEVRRLMEVVHAHDATVPISCLFGREATAEALERALPQHVVAHLSCHAGWNPVEPLESGLLLSGGRDLMLARLLGQRRLDATKLVVLSACDSGAAHLGGFESEEYLGLPAAFLVAGARAVIASLWAVADLPTALLMVELYRRLLAGSESAAALRAAQLWLRTLEKESIADQLAELWESGVSYLLARQRRAIEHWLQLQDGAPFAHPHYWAGFVAVGAPVQLADRRVTK